MQDTIILAINDFDLLNLYGSLELNSSRELCGIFFIMIGYIILSYITLVKHNLLSGNFKMVR